MFLSVRTLEVVPEDAKVCNSCRSAYYQWRRKTPEYDEILTRLNGEMSHIETDTEVSILHGVRLR